MSKDTIRLRFNGPAVDDHSMDVVELGPSLLAVGELCKLANKKFNQDRASVRVLARTDSEHGCFEVTLEVVQSFIDEMKGLIGSDDVRNIKEILEWLGLVGSVAIGGPLGLFKLLAWLKGRKPESVQIEHIDGKNVVRISVEGDSNTVVVHPEAWTLAQDKTASQKAAQLVQPLENENYESIQFEETKERTETLSREDALGIVRTSEIEISESQEQPPQEFSAWLTVHAPVYDDKAERWRFRFGTNIEYFDISQTAIATDAIERGGALINDAYFVKVKLVQSVTSTGKISNKYTIVDVVDFKPARLADQGDFLRDINITDPGG